MVEIILAFLPKRVLTIFQKGTKQHWSPVHEGIRNFPTEVHVNNQVKSVFLVDCRLRQAYMQFRDVVSFNVTFKTNTFNMPFAPFVGIDHYKKSILFGCVVLADETDATIIWLFETWLECVWGRKPQGIITHQDIAMRSAIAKVFPKTCHRFFLLQKRMNANKHLKQMKAYNIDFQDE